ncbi:MAG: type IV pilus biogenesis/stability protein PilW [bacterium]|nr:type IV pilus biogenesis/stability protein PilW [Gammaproteobacteria bacterium]
MRQMPGRGVFVCTVVSLAVLLSSCVTEVTGPNRKADPEKQLQAYIDLGIGYIRNGEYARAKENLTKALNLDPKSAKAHHAMGRLFQIEGDYDLAETHFKRAISQDRYFTQAQNTYGAFLYGEGRYEEAIEHLIIAADDRLYQNRALVFENLGVCHNKLGNTDEAQMAFLRATQLNPRQPRALLELAEIRYSQKEFVESRSYYRRHISGSSQSARSLLLCVKLAVVFDKPDENASCSLTLRNVFPYTAQAREYERFIK